MDKTSKSSSIEQMEAEKEIISIVEKQIGMKLERNKKVILSDGVHIEPDFYSETNLVVGEIISHIGKLKAGQHRKLANDILKMLLLEKVTGKQYRKIIAVCDNAAVDYLKGKSFIAESIKQFDFEIIYAEISAETRNKLLLTQERQKMVNA